MFLTTANTLRMPPALLDRMEIIRIAGYTEDEKVQIAKQHLIPEIMKKHGLKDGELIIEDNAVTSLIKYYTREAGVRSLEREIANLARKAIKKIVAGEIKNLGDLCYEVLEPVRAKFDKPVTITSGYRSPELSEAIGSKATSQHCLGEAVDFEIEKARRLRKRGYGVWQN